MALFRDLVETNPDASQRFRKLGTANPRSKQWNGRSLGVRDTPSTKGEIPMIWVYEDGEPLRVLGPSEIRGLLVDVDDDWVVSNQ